MSKFYEFNQNNSGGSFVVDNYLCHRVVIEAESQDEATKKAEDMGVYFNGCATGEDCPCCGDRWYETYSDDGMVFPMKYTGDISFNDEKEWAQYMADHYGWTKPDVRIFYKSGDVAEVFKNEQRS